MIGILEKKKSIVEGETIKKREGRFEKLKLEEVIILISCGIF